MNRVATLGLVVFLAFACDTSERRTKAGGGGEPVGLAPPPPAPRADAGTPGPPAPDVAAATPEVVDVKDTLDTAGDRADQTAPADRTVSRDEPAGDDAGPGVTIRVSTLNLRCLKDEWDRRRPLVVAALAALDPDLMGFQEACAERDPGGRDNLAELLGDLRAQTGRSYHVLRADTHIAWDTYQEGIAMVSALPVVAEETVALPDGLFPRRVAIIQMSTPAGPIVMATTHLDHQDGQARSGQAQAVVEALGAFAPAGTPALITGDMNEGPGEGVGVAYAAAGFVDVWAALRPGEQGLTFPSDAPVERIDYVWLRAAAGGPRPVAVERFLERASGSLYGSDHVGVTADFEL